MTKKAMMKRGALALAGGLLIVFFMGPGPQKINYSHVNLELPEDLDTYLQKKEARFDDITPNTEKKISWYAKKNTRTELAVIYLHGYSATRQELVPVHNNVAKKLKANLFETRLAGHGRGEKIAEANANSWLADADEALQIGKRLGNKVIIIAVSTGVPLALWITKEDPEAVHAMIFASANFGPKDKMSQLLLWPWGPVLLKYMVGEYYSWTPKNEGHAKYWTHRYPSRNLVEMMALVDYTSGIKLESIHTPTLFLYTQNDTVIDTNKIQEAYEQLGSQKKKIVNFKQAHSHVIAGDIVAPQMNAAVFNEIMEFINSLN